MSNDVSNIVEKLGDFILNSDDSKRLILALCDVHSDYCEISIVLWTIEEYIHGLITEKDLICALNVYKSNRGKLLKED